MKSIVYILITVFICGILVSAYPKSNSNQKQVVEIQCVVNNPDSKLLDEACLIIKKRLNDNEVKNFDVSINSKRGIIEITFNEKIDLKDILPLLISKGEVEFYETYNRTEVIKLLNKGDKLFTLLNIASENSEIDNSSAILGFCKPELTSQVDSYNAQYYVSKPGEGINFVWGKDLNKNGECYLYLLKHNSVLSKQQIMEVSVNKVNESCELMITFNKDGALVLQNLSKNNINKSIALVIDKKVYFAPVLKNEIKDGKCSISGNFTFKELTQLKSLITNGTLPLDFKIVK